MKNELVKLYIEDMNNDGLGIAKSNGLVFFVKNGLIGDKVLAIITKETKNIIYAKVQQIIEESIYRVNPICNVSDSCGGCQLDKLDFDKQIELKVNLVKKNLKNIGKIDEITIENAYDGVIYENNILHYRNKIEIPLCKRNNKIISGFYAKRTHYIIENDNCPISFEGSQVIIDIIKKALKKANCSIFDETTKKGNFKEIFLRKSNNKNSVSIVLIVKELKYNLKIAYYKKISDLILNTIKNFKCDLNVENIYLNINNNDDNTLLGDKFILLYGNKYLTDKLNDINFNIMPQSFYQINNKMTEKLYNVVVSYLDINKNQNILDLYCGIGTITLILSKYCNIVCGFEIVEQAIICSFENAKQNNIKNAYFKCLDVNDISNNNSDIVIKNYKGDKQNFNDIKFDTICIDPPRKGLDKNIINYILNISPQKIIYVSCDSATLSRDLNIFLNNGYELKKIKLVDMFSYTMHVETVVLLTRNT